MHGDRRKNVSLAITAIIRGLDSDDIAFRYDESAVRELAGMYAQRVPPATVTESACDGQ